MGILNEAVALFDSEDADYINWWDKQTYVYNDAGVYQQATDLITPHEGVHVDMGMGTGILLAYLQQHIRGAVIMGVEKSQHIIAKANYLLGENEVSHMCHCALSVSFEEGKINRVMVSDKAQIEKMDVFNPNSIGRVNIIGDDIRNPVVLRDFLNGRLLDSASYVFPGTGSAAAFEAPYVLDPSVDIHEIMKRRSEISADTRKRVYEQLGTLVKEGGELVVVERVMTKRESLSSATLHSACCAPPSEHWEDGESFVIENIKLPKIEGNNLGYHSVLGGTINVTGSDVTVIGQKFTRNNVAVT